MLERYIRVTHNKLSNQDKWVEPTGKLGYIVNKLVQYQYEESK